MPRTINHGGLAKAKKLKPQPVPLAPGVHVPTVPVGAGTIGGLAGAALAFAAALAAAIADQSNEAVAGVIVAGVALVTVIAGRFHQSGKAIDAAAKIVSVAGLPEQRREAKMTALDIGETNTSNWTQGFSRTSEFETRKKVRDFDSTEPYPDYPEAEQEGPGPDPDPPHPDPTVAEPELDGIDAEPST